MEIRNRPSAKGLVALNTRVEGVHVDKVSDLLR